VTSALSRAGAFALPLVATVIAYLAFGWWGLAGGVAGALAAWSAGAAGGGIWVRSLAAALPPLLSTGPTALLVVALFALVLAWERTGDARVFLFGGLALFVPYPGASFVATVCGALLLATAQGRWIAAGAGLCLAAWLLAPGEATLATALAVPVGLVARALAHHPANATVARALLGAGVLLLALPALALVGLVAAGALPGGMLLLTLAGLGAAAVGAVLLAAHAGLAALHLSDARATAAWSVLTWSPLLAAGILTGEGVAAMGPPWLAVIPLLGSAAVAFAVGARWISQGPTRQQVPAKS
jgi:hypothetical protein